METYGEFLDRINSFENKEPDFECYRCGLVACKVDGFNRFKNFYGDTVVFDFNCGVQAC